MPCTKRPLSRTRAILHVDAWDEKVRIHPGKKRRRYYWCEEHQAYHTVPKVSPDEQNEEEPNN